MSAKVPTLLVPGKLSAADAEPGETPLAYIQRWVRRRMPEFGGRAGALEDRVLVVQAETGTGKSTVLPVGLFRILRSEATAAAQRYRGPRVVCTQPRVLTAIALASDVSAAREIGGARVRLNPDMVLGDTVGFQTGPLSSGHQAGLVYATSGVLAAQLRTLSDAELMERYRVIIVDEAHERSLASDVMLMLLRNLYERNAGNPRLPFLLLTSATFDPARYAAYFAVGAANVVRVAGRAYGVARVWPAQGTNDYAAAAVAATQEIHERAGRGDAPGEGDILVFVPGADGAERVAQELVKANQRYAAEDSELGPLLVLVINRDVVRLQKDAFALLFADPGRLPLVGGRPPTRRVAVATIVAETGLTIDSLAHVVDCGLSRTREVYPPLGVEGIITRPAPRSRCEQRAGRAGRLRPGHYYPLFTENVYRALEEQQLPDIVTAGYSEAHLAVVGEQQRHKLRLGAVPEFRAEDVALLDPPAPEAFLDANATATALGLVSAAAVLPTRWPPECLETLAADAPAAGDAPGGAPDEPRGETRGYGLTTLGHVAARFTRTSMEGVRVLLGGCAWGAAAADLVTAVAMFGTSTEDLLSGRERRRRDGDLPPGAAALRAALPPFLAARAGGGRSGLSRGGAGHKSARPPTEGEAFYFRARLLLADDFAEAVLIFDAFARQLEAGAGDPGPAATWCGEVGLSFESLADVARRRESVIDEMIVAGLDPFRDYDKRLSALPAADFTEGLRRFKRCLYDGLRGRLLRFEPEHPKGPGYVTRQGVHVRVPELLAPAMADRLAALGGGAPPRPRWILTDVVRLVPAPQAPEDRDRPLLYVETTNLVSVLDGYVAVDPTFDAPRLFATS